MCDEAVNTAIQVLVSSKVLVHYNPALSIVLATDASQYGIGAVLLHVCKDGCEKPIAYASRTLTQTEKNYAQIDREALSIVFGIKKFNQYLYGRKFHLITDHKPLTSIFSPKKGITPQSAARLQRWAVMLSAYTYTIEYKPTQSHGNADALSRLPLKQDSPSDENATASSLFNLSQIDQLPVDSSQIRSVTSRDVVLSKVVQYTRQSWPITISESLKPYYNRANEISIECGVLMWGVRVIVPSKLQHRVLEMSHESHPGINKMKLLARSYCWWPGIDQDIQKLAKSCTACLSVAPTPAVSSLHPWLWPSKPWQRIHIDFASPMDGHMYFLVIDSHSKWPEIYEMTSTSTSRTIEILRRVFSVFGLPEQLVSDNGPKFVSSEFARFMKENGVKHLHFAPYHPATNGIVERMVQTFKKAMMKGKKEGRSEQHILSNFLTKYRSTPHSVTGVAPCELMLKRPIRTVLDLLKPSVSNQVINSQAMQKSYHDKKSQNRTIAVGQLVMVRNYRKIGSKWVEGTIVKKSGEKTFLVKIADGQVWKRHLDQVFVKEGIDYDYDHPGIGDGRL